MKKALYLTITFARFTVTSSDDIVIGNKETSRLSLSRSSYS